MGFASYFENIVERLTTDFQQLRNSITKDGRSGTGKNSGAHIQELLKLCEQAIHQLNKELETATDPALDFPTRVRELENDVMEKRRDMKELTDRLALSKEKEQKQNQTIAELQDKVTALNKEMAGLKRELGELLMFKASHSVTPSQWRNSKGEHASPKHSPKQIVLAPSDLTGKFGGINSKPLK